MKKKKIIIVILIIISIISIITGIILEIVYAPKKAINPEIFISITKNNNLKVKTVDIKDQNGNKIKEVKEALNAESKLGWTLEFYILENEETAKKNYSQNKKIYSSYKNQLSDEKEKNRKNYDVFTLKTQTSFMHVCRVDNTILAISADDEDEKSIETVIKKLGYN